MQFCFNCIIIITSPFYLTFTIKIITNISCCSLHFRNRRCFYNFTSRSTPFSSNSNFTNKILHRFFFIISCFTLLKHQRVFKRTLSACFMYVSNETFLWSLASCLLASWLQQQFDAVFWLQKVCFGKLQRNFCLFTRFESVVL